MLNEEDAKSMLQKIPVPENQSGSLHVCSSPAAPALPYTFLHPIILYADATTRLSLLWDHLCAAHSHSFHARESYQFFPLLLCRTCARQDIFSG